MKGSLVTRRLQRTFCRPSVQRTLIKNSVSIETRNYERWQNTASYMAKNHRWLGSAPKVWDDHGFGAWKAGSSCLGQRFEALLNIAPGRC